jgi:Type II secretion system (T2SS), protein E, N-terminal domain
VGVSFSIVRPSSDNRGQISTEKFAKLIKPGSPCSDPSSNKEMEMEMQGIRLGEIMVEQHLLTQSEVQQILSVQKKQGRPFGVLAEQLFGLNPRAVETAWVKQYAHIAGVEDPTELSVDADCIRLLNRRQAWQFHVAPIARINGELVLLTDEKHLSRALRFASETFNEPSYFRITTTEKLKAFLAERYPMSEFLQEYAERF